MCWGGMGGREWGVRGKRRGEGGVGSEGISKIRLKVVVFELGGRGGSYGRGVK